MNLTDISRVKELMGKYGISFQKKYGQNFLINPTVPERIADSCGADEKDAILEIGPGIGTLTQHLCERYKKVVAVEIDTGLIPVLAETLSPYTNATILCADIMKVSLSDLWTEHFNGFHVTVCANLPYYITTPVLMYLLESELPFENITVMIQKEVADRLCAVPGTSEYGAVTASVNYYAKVEKLFTVSAGNFMPAPKVDSTVIRMQLYRTPPVSCANKDLMFRLIRAAFNQRRKTLANALSAGIPTFEKSIIADAIRSADLPEDIRGERLSIVDFARLADALTAKQ